MAGLYMMACCASGGLLPTEKGSGDDFKCTTPRNNPLVVMAECTRVMLEDRALTTARMVAGGLLDSLDPVHWVQPSSVIVSFIDQSGLACLETNDSRASHGPAPSSNPIRGNFPRQGFSVP
ncbi:hypothetical protein ACJJTC_008056 [Scirpophaga incertulas]